eukprot:2492553-Lingulodinium_polyedra.AAC.1
MRWPCAGHELATRWPRIGHTLLVKLLMNWPQTGHELATRWPCAGQFDAVGSVFRLVRNHTTQDDAMQCNKAMLACWCAGACGRAR